MEHNAKMKSMTPQELDELSVRCLLLPLHTTSLLLPNTVVAEVLDDKPVEKAANMPAWMLGMLSWRGRDVPVISFEKLLGSETGSETAERRLVVCNTLNGNSKLPFVVLEVLGIPHLTMVTNDMLEADTGEQQHEPVVQARLRLNEESVIVPNIDVMEKMLEHLGFAVA